MTQLRFANYQSGSVNIRLVNDFTQFGAELARFAGMGG
jgi:hypothetical protein